MKSRTEFVVVERQHYPEEFLQSLDRWGKDDFTHRDYLRWLDTQNVVAARRRRLEERDREAYRGNDYPTTGELNLEGEFYVGTLSTDFLELPPSGSGESQLGPEDPLG